MIEFGISPNFGFTTRRHSTVLSKLIGMQANDTIKCLFEFGDKIDLHVNMIGTSGEHALILAATWKYSTPEIFALILERCNIVHVADHRFETAFWKAIVSSNKEICKLLLESGKDLNLPLLKYQLFLHPEYMTFLKEFSSDLVSELSTYKLEFTTLLPLTCYDSGYYTMIANKRFIKPHSIIVLHYGVPVKDVWKCYSRGTEFA